MNKVIVALIGRPNVGKSTFFNWLVGKTEAIVGSISGITRDRHYGISEWKSRIFTVIDTGGYTYKVGDSGDSGDRNYLNSSILYQIKKAIIASDIIFFMVDATIGPIKDDYQIGELLRTFQKPIMLIVNKVDNTKLCLNSVDFYRLGFNKYYCLSSKDGSGSGDILNDLIKFIPPIFKKEKKIKFLLPTIAIVGRPNVGKSTLFNSFFKEEKHIVTNIPGTTRDALQIYYSLFGLKCVFIDTAGIRKRSKINDKIEYYSIIQTIHAITYASICLLIVDAELGWQSQDTNIFRLIKEKNKGIIIIINKWDKIKKTDFSLKEYEKKIREKISHFNDVPIIFISAIMKKRIFDILRISIKIFKNKKKKIKTSHLNSVILPFIQTNPPLTKEGKHITIKYCTQLPSPTPEFVFFSKMSKYIKNSYKKFIEKIIRQNFNFNGIPMKIYFQ